MDNRGLIYRREQDCKACKFGPEGCRFSHRRGLDRCTEFQSKRKPHSHLAGYIAERRNPLSGDWNVIYYAAEADIDDTDGRYACVCEAHGTIVNCTSLPQARSAMKASDFCEECREPHHGS